MLQVAVLFPSTVFAVIIESPTVAPTTVQVKPLLFNVTLLLLQLQVTVLFVALDGDIVAVSVTLLPTFNEAVVLFSDIP